MLASTAAGRACKPVGFGTRIAWEVTERPSCVASPSSPPATVISAATSEPAVTRPVRAVNDVRRSEFEITISVNRLLAVVATLSRSKVMSTSPVRTASPTETLAAHLDGVQTDVQQHLETLRRTDRDRMMRRMELGDGAVARSEEPIAERIDRYPFADHLLG